jgi:hypothetical protein
MARPVEHELLDEVGQPLLALRRLHLALQDAPGLRGTLPGRLLGRRG